MTRMFLAAALMIAAFSALADPSVERMNSAYVRVMSHNHPPGYTEELEDGQKQWLSYRNSKCSFDSKFGYDVKFEGAKQKLLDKAHLAKCIADENDRRAAWLTKLAE